MPEESLAELPDDVEDDVAAAVGVVGITALLALERAAPVEGARVLVLGATGAVGQMAVQLARAMGAARVVGAGRSAERLERVRELGADEVVELGARRPPRRPSSAPPAGSSTSSSTPLWGEPAMAALRRIATEGRLVNVGQPAGTDVRIPLETVRNRQGAIHAISSGWTELERKAAAYGRVLEHVRAGRLEVDRELVPLDEVGAAWERQEASPGRKLVVIGGAGGLSGALVGRAVRRREDERILRGATRYLDDIDPPGAAHVAFVRSPFAHARIGGIERARTASRGWSP